MKVGRDPSCDLMLNEVIFMGSTDEDLQLAKISRAQFELQRTGTNLVLKDKSMNGTYMLLLPCDLTPYLISFLLIPAKRRQGHSLTACNAAQHLTLFVCVSIISLNVTILSSW